MNSFFKIRNGKKVNTILLDLRCGRDIRVRYSTNLTFAKGSEKYWNKNNGEIKAPNDILGYQQINDKLYDYKRQINALLNDLNQNQRLTQQNCDEAIQNILKPISAEKVEVQEKIENNKPSQPKSLQDSKEVLDFFQWFIDFYSVNNSPFTKKKLTSGTARTYKNSRSYLDKYLKARKIKKFTFDDINQAFYYDFINFGHEKKYTRNYIGSMIQKLKTIINAAYDNGNHDNKEHTKRYFSKLKEEVNHPYLNVVELNKLLKLELTDTLEATVRDIFIINSYTGLRVGDLTTFLKNPTVVLKGQKKFIHLKQEKTGGEVYIPLNSIVLKILKQRNGNFPPFTHPHIINKKIKIIAEKAEINEPFAIEKTVGGKKTKIFKPKYDYITAHTARRSFCTNAYNKGMRPHEIMVISGHKSERVFNTYIKADVITKAMQVSKHSFFN